MSDIDGAPDPLLKWLTDNSVSDIENPLPRKLWNVSFVRHVKSDLIMPLSFRKNVSFCKLFVIGREQDLNRVAFDVYKKVLRIKVNLHFF